MRPMADIKVTVGSGRNVRSFSLPARHAREVEAFIISRLQQTAIEKSIPAGKVFPELTDDAARPATMLRGARYKAEMTQKQLAAKLEIRQHHLSEMEHAKRPIGKQMAKRLAAVLACDYRLFI
jgi:ribosome-binding protein aMBF1 (putative translation factor)